MHSCDYIADSDARSLLTLDTAIPFLRQNFSHGCCLPGLHPRTVILDYNLQPVAESFSCDTDYTPRFDFAPLDRKSVV